MFVNLFSKDAGEFIRYWASISTEKYDAKKKKGSGEYANASIPVRLSKESIELFEENASKTKNKKILGGKFELDEFWLEAVEPKEGEPYVRLFIKSMTPKED